MSSFAGQARRAAVGGTGASDCAEMSWVGCAVWRADRVDLCAHRDLAIGRGLFGAWASKS